MEKLGVAGIALGLFQGVSMGLWVGSLSCIVVLVLTFWWSKEAQKKMTLWIIYSVFTLGLGVFALVGTYIIYKFDKE